MAANGYDETMSCHSSTFATSLFESTCSNGNSMISSRILKTASAQTAPKWAPRALPEQKLHKSLSKMRTNSHVLILFRFHTLKTLERRDVFPLKIFHDVSKIPNNKTLHRRSHSRNHRKSKARTSIINDLTYNHRGQ